MHCRTAFAQPDAAPSASSTRRRVLVVDDEPAQADLICHLLAHPQLEISTANNGVAAVAQARETRPSLILLDIGLPLIDGFEVFRLIRRLRSLAGTRVLLMSGYAEDGAMRLACELGAEGFLHKPFGRRTLRSMALGVLGIADDEDEQDEE